MKTIPILIIWLMPVFAAGQARDSLAGVKVVDSLLTAAKNLLVARKFQEALPVAQQAADISKEKWGENNAFYASSLHRLASIYASIVQNDKAIELYLKAIDLRAKVIGRAHPDYAASLNNLAMLYRATGNYEKAELLYLEAKDIWGKTLGKLHPNYAMCLNNIGVLYYIMGNYEKAEPFYLEANSIREKTLGKENPDYAQSLFNLAVLYDVLGNHLKAEQFFLEVNAIDEKTVGKEHPDYSGSLSNLANFYKNLGNYKKAETLFLEALTIYDKVLGKEHPDYVRSLTGLAVLYRVMRNYEKAEPLLLEALTIEEKVLGKEHPYYIMSLGELAVLYFETNRYEKSDSLYLEVKTNMEKTGGKENPSYALYLNRLAKLYEKQNRFSESEPLLTELTNIENTRLTKASSFLSEQELARYSTTFSYIGNNLGAYILARPPDTPTGSLPALAFDHALFFKGFLLTSTARLNALIAASPESEEINFRLKGYRRRLAAQYAQPIAERKGVAELEDKASAAEKELARSVAGYAEAIRQVNWQEVRAALKQGEAAIEFVHFRVSFPKKTDSTMYAALILLPGSEQPKFIPLFEQKQLDSLLQRQSDRNELYVKQLYSLADRGATAVGKSSKSLYEILWQPLERELAGAKTIYFSPSGLLHRLNLSAIPISPDSTLADRYNLVELGSTRQLVIPSNVEVKNNDALLFGGIRYEMDTTAIKRANADLKTDGVAFSRGEMSFSQTDSTLRAGSWGFLPGTEKEVDAVEKIMQAGNVKAFARKGYAATEEAIKSIGQNGKPSPRILHIATHGFFFPDPRDTTGHHPFSDRETVFKISDNPLIRSGLIMAGGNLAWRTGKSVSTSMDDGILTAYEVSQMNLSNTELVVLSACETGLGDIQGNEGVYGLQRAFKIAGAKYLIMSLWQVPDRQTSLLMTTFYKKWLTDKLEIPAAFRAAQKELREAGLDPFQWAGFVLVE